MYGETSRFNYTKPPECIYSKHPLAAKAKRAGKELMGLEKQNEPPSDCSKKCWCKVRHQHKEAQRSA